jgi:hypothetical protein
MVSMSVGYYEDIKQGVRIPNNEQTLLNHHWESRVGSPSLSLNI